jgi:hypothetical protein
MSYRDNLDALAARHAALETEVAHKTRELDAAARMLEEARTKAKLPVLDNIRVASPCSASWAKMSGDERTRFCGDCKKNVHNLSEMTREEAEALIVEKEGRLCVRYYQRHDGTILLKDCTVGVKRKRKRRIIVAGAAAMLAGGVAYAIATKREKRVEAMVGDVEPREMVQGGISPDPEPPPQAEPPKPDETVQVLGEWK